MSTTCMESKRAAAWYNDRFYRSFRPGSQKRCACHNAVDSISKAATEQRLGSSAEGIGTIAFYNAGH